MKEHKKVLKKAFSQWRAFEYINDNPFNSNDLSLPSGGNKKEKPFWLLEEIQEILNRAPENYYPFWATLAHTGMRWHEANTLIIPDIDFIKATITITGKGNKTRILPINSSLYPILARLKENKERGYCFPDIARSEQGCLKVLKKTLEGIQFTKSGPINIHRFRHSFASNLLRSGANIKQVQKLMGHSTVKTTLDIYGHLMPEDLHTAAELLTMKPEKSAEAKCIQIKSTKSYAKTG